MDTFDGLLRSSWAYYETHILRLFFCKCTLQKEIIYRYTQVKTGYRSRFFFRSNNFKYLHFCGMSWFPWIKKYWFSTIWILNVHIIIPRFFKDRCHDLVFSIIPHMVQLSKPKSFIPNSEEIAALDRMSEDLQVIIFKTDIVAWHKFSFLCRVLWKH